MKKNSKKVLWISRSLQNSIGNYFKDNKLVKKPENFEGEFYLLIKKAIYIQNTTGFNIDKCPYCGKPMEHIMSFDKKYKNYYCYCKKCHFINLDEYEITNQELKNIDLKIPSGSIYNNINKKIEGYEKRRTECYKVLELEEDASQEEISKSYYKLIKEYSPTKNGNSLEKLEQIDYAYDVLFDMKKLDIEKRKNKSKKANKKDDESKEKPKRVKKEGNKEKEQKIKSSLFYINGREAEIFILEDYIELDFTGNIIKKFVSEGGGIKRIYYHQIQSIQKRDAGNLLTGSLEFEVGGMSQSRMDGKTENVVHYDTKYQEEANKIFEFVNKKIMDIHNAKINPSQTITESSLDKIKKAKDLLDMGAITQEEFDEIKAKCLKDM